MPYKPVIGLEIHVELKTRTKMFCDSLNNPDEKHPNINVCPICMGHPGTLPVINQAAVEKVIMAGLALNCQIEKETFFERKQYFYPDLPKGYQISQYQKPLCYGGWLDIGSEDKGGENNKKNQDNPSIDSGLLKRIRITRIHLEEDAGRLYHEPGKNYSLVDYNRAGLPLMELVTEPDFASGAEVKAFTEELQLIFRYLGVSDADMEKGLMRVEVNISLMDDSQSTIDSKPKWGTKVEIKNLNSIRAAADSVDYEIKRQTDILDSGEKVKQETRGFDDVKRTTFSQRSKEEAHDYRYFPEPDLPPIHLADRRASSDEDGPPVASLVHHDGPPVASLVHHDGPPVASLVHHDGPPLFYIDEIRDRLPELPQKRRDRFAIQYGLPVHDVEVFTVNKKLGDFFEHVASELASFENLTHLQRPSSEHQTRILKLGANYLITEYSRMCQEVSAEADDTLITPERFADFVVRVFHGQISSSGAQTLLKEMFASQLDPGKIIEDKNLGQVSDSSELESLIRTVLGAQPKAVEDLKAGKEASLKFLIGMVMRESKGRANPQVTEQLIKDYLKLN